MDDRRKLAAYGYEDLLAMARGEIFGMENGKLPLPPMLMFDRITEITDDGGAHGKGHMVAELDVNPDLWFFKCHFKGDPVMPGCLGLDAMWQLVGFYLVWSGSPGIGRALGCGGIKFTGQVLPGVRRVEYRIDMTRVIRGRLVVGLGDATMSADGEVIYVAKDLKVGLFKQANVAAASSAAAPETVA